MRVVAFDTETWLIAPGRVIPPLVCATFFEDGKEPTIHHVRGDACAVWMGHLRDRGTLLVGHNVCFDLAVMVDACPDKEGALRAVFEALEAGRVRDTLLRQKVFHIRKGDLQTLRKGALGLADLAKAYLGEEMKKGEDTYRKRYSELAEVPLSAWPGEAVHYAKHDARQTLRVFKAQQEVFERMQYVGKEPFAAVDEVFQLRAAWALHLMQAWGIRTDPEKVQALEQELLREIDEHTATLVAAGIVRRDGSQDMGVLRGRVVEAYRTLGKDPPKTDKGSVATDKQTVEAVKHLDPMLVVVQERKHAEKVLTTFLEPAKQGTRHPLTASFNVMLASTRTSCSGGRIDGKPSGTNLQNMPKKAGVRECFVPRAGTVYADADYNALEMRTFAQIMFELRLPDVLRQTIITKKDPHSMLGATLLGISYEDFTARRKAGDEAAEDTRALAKVGNFGMMGGLGAPKFKDYVKQFGIDIDVKRAMEIKSGWMRTWQTKGYFDWVNGLINEDTGMGSVKLSSGLVRGACTYTVACNTPFQSRAAYGAKEALWNVARESYLDRSSDLFGSRMVNFVHDEILMEVPEGHASEAAMRLKRIMEESMMVWTPAVPQEASPALMRWWDKKAKPVVDDDGRLVPWGDEEDA